MEALLEQEDIILGQYLLAKEAEDEKLIKELEESLNEIAAWKLQLSEYEPVRQAPIPKTDEPEETSLESDEIPFRKFFEGREKKQSFRSGQFLQKSWIGKKVRRTAPPKDDAENMDYIQGEYTLVSCVSEGWVISGVHTKCYATIKGNMNDDNWELSVPPAEVSRLNIGWIGSVVRRIAPPESDKYSTRFMDKDYVLLRRVSLGWIIHEAGHEMKTFAIVGRMDDNLWGVFPGKESVRQTLLRPEWIGKKIRRIEERDAEECVLVQSALCGWIIQDSAGKKHTLLRGVDDDGWEIVPENLKNGYLKTEWVGRIVKRLNYDNEFRGETFELSERVGLTWLLIGKGGKLVGVSKKYDDHLWIVVG